MLTRRFAAVRGPRESGEPTRCGVFLDDAFAHGFAESFVNTLNLTVRDLLIVGLDRLPGFFHQRAQSRFDFDVARAPFHALPVAFFN